MADHLVLCEVISLSICVSYWKTHLRVVYGVIWK